MDSPSFEIQESQDGSWRRLTLYGELDMSTAVGLKRRLGQLRTSGEGVLMDLSQLEFMDSSGLHIMIESITSASADGWRFAIDPDLPAQVKTLFRMTNLDRFVGRRQDA